LLVFISTSFPLSIIKLSRVVTIVSNIYRSPWRACVK
jgi:hypothetical protein